MNRELRGEKGKILASEEKPTQAMASHSHPSSPICFFKIILKSNLESIRIPNKFTGRYGSGLSNPVFLKPPDGKEWKMHQTKHDNEIWFQEGWKEFASFYSLDEGHLVLFKYEGTCQFDVHIFDKSALEIDYPSSSKNNLSDDTLEILDEMPPNQKATHKTPLSSSRPCKKMRSLQNLPVAFKTNPGQCQGTEFQKSTNAELKLCKQEPEDDGESGIFTKSTACLNSEQRRKKATTTVEKIRALISASSFKSENPFFKVVMQPSHVSGKCYLVMPIKFAKRHLKKECGVVQLEVLDGRTWPARYKIPIIGVGWEKFVMDNGLNVGHVCVFEMIGRTFKVHIFRDDEEGNLNVIPFKDEQISSLQQTPLEEASSFKSEHPHFMVKMTHAYIFRGSNLHVPTKFARTHFDKSTKSAKLVVKDVAWPVGCIFRRDSHGCQLHEFSSRGWKQFRADNDLKVGDVCVFELIPETEFKLTFQVTIFGATKHPI